MPWVRQRDYGLSAVAGPDAVELHTRLPLTGENMHTVARFRLREGDRVPMTLSYHPSHQKPHFVPDRAESLDRTTAWWQEWVKGGQLDPMPEKWRAAVVRSLITLKLLTFQPTGGIVAAPTTSLPEFIGGSRNWDYRYCWLRDSALTLYALLNAGHRHEADAWRQWLLRAVAGHPLQLQIMYGIAGERWLPEFEVPWLDGYENSRPGPPRQRRGEPDAARRLRRTDRHAPRRTRGGAAAPGRGLEPPAGAPRPPRGDLAEPRPRHLGNARRAEGLHPFAHDVLGGVRSRGQERRAVRSRRTRRQVEEESAPPFMPTSARRASTTGRRASPSTTEARRSTRAFCSCRRRAS